MTSSQKHQRALILIDVQNEYVTGNLPIEYPPLAISLQNISLAINTARENGIPIVIVQQMAAKTSPIFAEGSDGWQLHPIVKTFTPDLLIQKTLPSALAGTELSGWLRKKNVDTLVVAGFMSQNCNESTIRQAAHEGWSVEYLHDAAGAVSYRNAMGFLKAKDMHEASCIVIQSRFAAVMNTRAWINSIRHGTPAVRESLYQSYRQSQSPVSEP